MGKKDKAIRRLEAEVGRLTAELAKVERAARKGIARAEKDVLSLRDDVRKVLGRGGLADKSSAPDQTTPIAESAVPHEIVESTVNSAAVVEVSADKKASGTGKAPTPKKAAATKKAPADRNTPARGNRSGPTVAELRAKAKSQGVKGYSSMTKAQLLAAVK